MRIIREFDPVIYPYKLWISVGVNAVDIVNEFKYYDGTDIDESDEWVRKNFKAMTLSVRKKSNRMLGVLLLFENKKNITFETVAHESCHAAKYLFEHIGADVKEHEPFEYVIGWIAKCCEKVKNNKYE